MSTYNIWKRPENYCDDYILRPGLPLTKEDKNNLVKHYKMEDMDISDGYIESIRAMVREYKHIFGTHIRGDSCSPNEKVKRAFGEGNLGVVCPQNDNLDIKDANEKMDKFFKKVGIKSRFEIRCVFK